MYGQERYKQKKLLGYGRHFIPLWKNQMGKKLTIEMHISENNAFDGQQPVIISDGRKLISKDIAGEKVQPCDINVSYGIWCDNNDFIDAYAEKLGKLYTDILYSNVFISGRVLDIVQYGSDRVFCTESSGKDIYGIYDILCSAAAVYILFQGQA